MKKFFFTMIALIAFGANVFAQFTSFNSIPVVRHNTPVVTCNVPFATYKAPDITNYNTVTVSGYSRSNGTYVDSHIRTLPNNTNRDNFSTIGNSNPVTGSTGYRARDYSLDALNYGSGQIIHTGPRGGQYYINNNGNRVYVPKRINW